MNNLTIITLTIVLAIGIISCSNTPKSANKDFNSFYEEHEKDKGVVSFTMPMMLAKMFIDTENDEIEEVVDKLEKVKIFVCESDTNDYSEIIKPYLSENNYSDLMEINENNENIIFKIRKPKNEKIKEIILTIKSSGNFVAAAFNGDFTTEDAKKLTKAIRTKDMKNAY